MLGNRANVSKARQCVWLELKISVSKEPNDGVAPDLFEVSLFKENRFPGVILREYASGHRQMNIRMLIELATIGMQGTKNANFVPKTLGLFEHGTRGTAKKLVK